MNFLNNRFQAHYADPQAARDPRSPMPAIALRSEDGDRELCVTLFQGSCHSCRSPQCKKEAVAVSIIWRSVGHYHLRQELEALTAAHRCQSVNAAGQHTAVICGSPCAERVIDYVAQLWQFPEIAGGQFQQLAKAALPRSEPLADEPSSPA